MKRNTRTISKKKAMKFFADRHPGRGPGSLLAELVGVSPQSVDSWPDNLPPRIADRVIAAQARLQGLEPLQDGIWNEC